MNITVVGLGYVGLSLSLLLAQSNKVIAYDIDKKRIEKIKKKISPIKDKYIEKYLKSSNNLVATFEKKSAYKNSKFIVIATPTDYNSKENTFDTSKIDTVLRDILKYKSNSPSIIIKSTLPVGYTEE